MHKRNFLKTVAGLAAAPMALNAAWAKTGDFPNKPITLIQPYSAGGPTDQHLRVLAVEMGRILEQPVMVESRPGANGVLAATALTRAQPDGYTLGVLAASSFREPYINKVPFDPLTSFSYIAMLSDYAFGLAVRHDAPWKTWADFAADARKRPGVLSVGATGGASGTPRIAVEEAMETTGIQLNVVPYKGDADVVTAILGGHLDASPLSGVAVPHIEAKKMRYLVMFTPKRIARFPDLPTLKEAGVDVSIDSPYGVAGPKGMDPARVQLLSNAFHKALVSPGGMEIMSRLNQVPNYLAPKDYERYAQSTFGREKQRVEWMKAKGLLG